MFEREDRETKQDQKNRRLARAQTVVFLIRVWRASLIFTQNHSDKGARTGSTRIAERSSKRHEHRQPAIQSGTNIVSLQLEGQLGPTYGIGDGAQRARTRQI